MKALKIEPGKAPERIDIGNELEALQDAVGGYIQVLYPDQHRPVGLICNEAPDDDVQAACRKLGADLAAW